MSRILQTIIFDISTHGLGHLGQVAPVIQELIARNSGLHVIVRSSHPAPVVRRFIGLPIDLDMPPPEATLVMRDPTNVDAVASGAAYHKLHARWHDNLEREAARLAARTPTALIADVPYLSLAAAKRLGIPAIALCSLNWLDLYKTYCAHADDAVDIMHTIESAYRSADIFLQPQPHMPMTELPNRRSIGPIARLGRRRSGEIRSALGIPQNVKIVLVTFGGIQSRSQLQLPTMAGVHWLLPPDYSTTGLHATNVSQIDMSFIDLLASSDAVVTKVGYCTFVEAACNGLGLVSAPRDDWPESEHLIEWAKQNGNFSLADIEDTDELRAALTTVLARSHKQTFPSGTAEAVDIIEPIAKLK